MLGADGAPNKHRVLGRDVGARRGASREGPPPRRLPPVCVVVARAPREGQAAHHTTVAAADADPDVGRRRNRPLRHSRPMALDELYRRWWVGGRK